jgi:chaperonin cofactor prefoldin
MPNTLLYGYDAAAKDLKQLYDKDQHYRSLQAELVKIKQGSPEENLFLKKNKKELDNRLRDFASYADSLEEKYSKLKMVRTR